LIGETRRRIDPPSYFHQDIVAHLMAVSVIDLFEMVNIDQVKD
jgi:hypothetical protein